MLINLRPEYGVNYKAGQVYFTFQSGSPISEGITFFTYRDSKNIPDIEKVSHCGICIGDGIGISAQPHGYDYENLSEIFQDSKRRIFFKEPGKLDILGEDELIKTCKAYLGTPYNFRLATGFAVTNSWLARTCLSREFRKKWLKSFDEKNHLICSQAVIMMLCLSQFSSDVDFLKSPKDLVYHPLFKEMKQIVPDKYKAQVLANKVSL